LLLLLLPLPLMVNRESKPLPRPLLPPKLLLAQEVVLPLPLPLLLPIVEVLARTLPL
jgi:hypothetical protein